MGAQEENQRVFDFLRKRMKFVDTYDGFEAWGAWGPVVDALSTIHAHRLSRETKKNRECFQTGMIELVRFVDLRTISVPLLFHSLHRSAATSPESALIFSALFGMLGTELAPRGQIWSASKDLEWADRIAKTATSATSKVAKTFRDVSYASILYTEYRCPLVHGLDFGWRTWTNSENGSGSCDDAPSYMNCFYAPGDPRPAQHQVRFRISFSRGFLGRVLRDMIDNEEAECAATGWSIGRYPTRTG